MLHIRLKLLVLELTTNETLEREHGVGRVDDRLPFCGKADKTLPMLRESDYRWCCPGTLGVLNHLRSLPLHDGDAGICCSKVNTNDGAYVHTLALRAIENVACQQTTYH